MLALSRKVGETIRIGDDVTITVIGVKGKKIRIGIEAPKTTTVHREEIWAKIKEGSENAEKCQ